jgi:UDP-glucose 4-epimerase
MMGPQTLLLTGACGFLGRYVAREFLQRGWQIYGLDLAPGENAPSGITYEQMPLPSPRLAELIQERRPQACIHAAGRASVALSHESPEVDFQHGVVVTFELLNKLRLHAPTCRTVLLSSAAVYGNPASLPIAESAQLVPISPYGFHKLQAEFVGEEFATLFGLPTAAVRIFSAYGVGLRRQVVWDISEKALRTGRVELRGTGAESRDFIHAADIALALATVLESAPMQGERYNVASGEETTIAELAASLLTELGITEPAQFTTAGLPGDPANWRADITRLRALGFQPQVSLAEGLRGVATWAQAELGIGRKK